MLHFRNNSKIKYQNRREGQNRYPFTYMAGNYSNLVLVQLIIVCHLFFFLFWSLFCLFFFDLLFLITYLVSSKIFHVRCHASMGRYGTFLSRYGNLTHFDPMKNILLLVYDTSKQNSWIYKDISLPLEASGLLVLRSCSRHIFVLIPSEKFIPQDIFPCNSLH